jgi:hypothetical protein
MSNIHTANKRHKRAITLKLARNKAAEQAPVEQSQPAKAEG